MQTGEAIGEVTSRIEDLERFLFREARLMDSWRLQEWLALWDDDAEIRYWVPCGHDDVDPDREVSIVYDDRSRLRDRVHRLESSSVHAQDPRSRLSRVIGNVELVDDVEGVLTVESTFVLAEFRHDQQTVYAGRCIHRLRMAGDAPRLVSKKVLLVNNAGFFGNLTFLL